MINSNISKIPFYEVYGSYSDIGEFIGSTFRETIQERIKERKLIEGYDKYLLSSYKDLDLTEKYFPNLIEETKSIAKSADVALIDYFFLNNRDVFDPDEKWDRLDAVKTERCNTIVGFDQNVKVIVGHNENEGIDKLKEIYLLKANIGDMSFISLNYFCEIPGTAFSMNSYGLVQCVNELHQNSQIGIPKNYISRALIEAKSIDDAKGILNETPRASGFNHLLACDNSATDIEVSFERIGIETVVNSPFVHTNHFLIPEMKHYETYHSNSSERRYEKAKASVKPIMNFEDVKSSISIKDESGYPTIASAIFIPSEKRMFVCQKSPDICELIKYTL